MPILGVIASGISGHLTPPWPDNSYYQIATTTVGAGGTTSIEFTSIPSTYTHLQIRAFSRDNRSPNAFNNILTQFNGDTSTTYSNHSIRANGSTVASYGDANYIGEEYTLEPSSGTSSSIFAISIYDILEYANTNIYKTLRVLNGFDANGSGVVTYNSANWRNTNAITSIRFRNSSTNSFVQYTQFSLYGIKV